MVNLRITIALSKIKESMIERLLELEERYKSGGFPDSTKMEAVRNLKHLLLKINVRAEWIPLKSQLQIIALLEDLKGGSLDKIEKQIIGELLN